MNFPYASRPIDDGFDKRGAGRGIPVLMDFTGAGWPRGSGVAEG